MGNEDKPDEWEGTQNQCTQGTPAIHERQLPAQLLLGRSQRCCCFHNVASMWTTREDEEIGNKDEECGADGSRLHRDHLKKIHTRYCPNPFTEKKIYGTEHKPTYPNPESIKTSENFWVSQSRKEAKNEKRKKGRLIDGFPEPNNPFLPEKRGSLLGLLYPVFVPLFSGL